MTGYAAYGRTERGTQRAENEDHILLGRFIKNRGGLALRFAGDDDFLARHGLLFAVADGIGGERGGATASRMALEALDAQFYSATKDPGTMDALRAPLEAAGDRANRTLLNVGAHRPEWAGMGCVIAGVCLGTAGCLVFHAGDVRVYRFRHGALKPLTSDDSVVGIAVQAGYMNEREAEASPMRNTITNCVGGASFQLHLREEPPLREGEALLICSDGLHGALEYERIEQTMADHDGAENRADALVDAARRAGTGDDISVVVIDAERSQP